MLKRSAIHLVRTRSNANQRLKLFEHAAYDRKLVAALDADAAKVAIAERASRSTAAAAE